MLYTNICGGVNVLLSVVIKSSTAPCHFVFTNCTDNSWEYSVLKVLHIDDYVLTSKLFSSKKPPVQLREGVGMLFGVSSVDGNITNASTLKTMFFYLWAS
jgi:hypothetical protein